MGRPRMSRAGSGRAGPDLVGPGQAGSGQLGCTINIQCLLAWALYSIGRVYTRLAIYIVQYSYMYLCALPVNNNINITMFEI